MPFDWTINPYRGCTHACVYCFARPTHTYLDMDAGRDFETKIVVKVNAPERAAPRARARRAGRASTSRWGPATDPYQRAEGRYRLMPGIIEVLTERRNPFSILTKGTLILRDLELLVRGRAVADVVDGVLDRHASTRTRGVGREPGRRTRRARLEAVARAERGRRALLGPDGADPAGHHRRARAAARGRFRRRSTPAPRRSRRSCSTSGRASGSSTSRGSRSTTPSWSALPRDVPAVVRAAVGTCRSSVRAWPASCGAPAGSGRAPRSPGRRGSAAGGDPPTCRRTSGRRSCGCSDRSTIGYASAPMDMARLLALQEIDTTIDRLSARKNVLESGGELATARNEADAAERALGELRLQLDVVGRDQSKLEHEIDSLTQKAAAEDKRLYDGSIVNAKELESIQHEIENLKRRRSDREDEMLGLMEVREELERRAAEAQTSSDTLRERVETVGGRRSRSSRRSRPSSNGRRSPSARRSCRRSSPTSWSSTRICGSRRRASGSPPSSTASARVATNSSRPWSSTGSSASRA